MKNNTKGIGFKNFRRFEEFPQLEFGNITYMVGRNNSGKSTMVKALLLIMDYLQNQLGDTFSFDNNVLEDANIVTFGRAKCNLIDEPEIVFSYKLNNYEITCHISGEENETRVKVNKLLIIDTEDGYVFNIDRFADSKREIVIVTEGVFDAILVDGVAIQGNAVGPEQAHLIEKLGKRVILCPDRDKAGIELVMQAAELGWEVSFPPWTAECKDAADAVQKYGRLATVSSIIKHATGNELKIKVKAKMI